MKQVFRGPLQSTFIIFAYMKFWKKIVLLLSILLVVGSAGAWFLTHSNYSIVDTERKVGDAIDSLDRVPVYFNGSVSHVLERNVAKDGYNLGLK